MRGAEPCSSRLYARLSTGRPHVSPKVWGLGRVTGSGDGVGRQRGRREGQQRRRVPGAPARCRQDVFQTRGDERGLVPPVPLWQQYPSSRT